MHHRAPAVQRETAPQATARIEAPGTLRATVPFGYATAVPRPLAHPWVDDRRAPLYVTTYPKETTDDSLREYLELQLAWLARLDEPVAWILDLSKLERSTAARRSMFASYLRRFGSLARHHLAGAAIVAPSALVRGFVTAVFWVYRPTAPVSFFATLAEAEAWAGDRLRERET